ncbi:excalibur calcium-binding domain-containing protein [Streptomyces sp. NPDC091371]|uniref:excalibur calcium-binding domain-containing protein n=1 Tax=Streptomyces sp. NPDC091371 TaxID=3155303 RepID=UPI00344047D3
MYSPPTQYSPYPQQPVRRWWQHPAVVITALVLLPPLGIALAWMSPWTQGKKIVATVLSGIWLLVLLFSDGAKKDTDDGKGKTAATASASPSTTAATATSSPSAAPGADAVMPAVTNMPFNQAEKAVEALIDGELTARSAYTDVTLSSAHANWVVCLQDPAAGAKLAKSAAATVHLVAPGTKCPATADTRLNTPETKKPTPTPDNDSASSGSGTGGGGAYYANCAAAKAAGAAPLRKGQSGYRSELDKDKDGIACDK